MSAPATPASRGAFVQALQARAARPVVRHAALVLVLGFFTINGIVAAGTHTPTADEFVYVPAGYYHLRTGDLGFDTTNPPLMTMAMAFTTIRRRPGTS